MGRVLEIVLNLPEPTVLAWLEQQGQSPERIDTALTETLDALPGFERTGEDVAPRMLIGFDFKRKLADGGWRVTTETLDGRRRAMASHREAHAPGVAICHVVCDAMLEPDAMLDPAPDTAFESAFGDAPAALAQVLADAGKLTTVATLETSRRITWRRQTARQVDVDVALVSMRCTCPGTDASPALRELRITTQWPDDEDDAGEPEAEPVTDDAVRALSEPVDEATHEATSPARPVPTAESALAALFAVANELVAALPAFPVLADAFDRVCRVDIARDNAPARARPLDLGGARTPHRALRVIERNIAEQWFGNEAVVRDAPDVEFIHQMRVAQRRLKTVTKIFPAWVDGGWTARIEPRLKRLSDLLGEARDWDVFADSTLPELAEADVDATSWNATRDAANQRRADARAHVQQALRSSAYAELVLAWLEWISDLAMRGTPEAVRGRSLRGYAKKRVAKHYDRVTRDTKLTALDDASRHRVRIQAKRLRYALEFLEPIITHKTRRDVVRTLSRVQSVLGDGNDAVVALHFLEQLDVPPYQLGFARGWCEALKRTTAKEGERLLGDLRKPKIASGGAG
ncbi:CHAD domain-containing protein [Paraburkholderia rhizosphaerae]|uniref:CHAD domain-containing protein n=1 Tax=Paraburkholderia rhizosphaerae TaxID=480658 RepID=A0A4R8LZ14_9BURK|nr:CHAD domain-containing protein [Paraburkholderia rhizosphaerae]TDY53891.1 CHAD domain-containing protein [Paraburkholderia rhizosphaerae]